MVATTVRTTGVAVNTASPQLFLAVGGCSEFVCGKANGVVIEVHPLKIVFDQSNLKSLFDAVGVRPQVSVMVALANVIMGYPNSMVAMSFSMDSE
jgi:hypothetical protein